MLPINQLDIRRAAGAFCDKKHGNITVLAREAGVTRQTVARFIGGAEAEEATVKKVSEALRSLGFAMDAPSTGSPGQEDSVSRFEIIGDKMIAIGRSLRSDEFSLDEKTRELESFIKNTAMSLGILDIGVED